MKRNFFMADGKGLIPKHGGYRNLKSFQISQLAYDAGDQ